MTIFQTSPYGTPSATNIFCADAWSAFSVYRELPVPTTTSTSSSVDSTLSTTQSDPRTSLPIPSQTSPSASQTNTSASQTSTSSPSPPESHSSKAWIAGVVVGVIAGLAIIVGLFFFFRRKQKKMQPEKPEEEVFVTSLREFHGAPSELAATNAETRHELAATHAETRHELSAYSSK
ncbi:hypothetical protein POX_a01170 [Penicillium oxalicum]|uniref:hypothetical protein n=1 Tax=Penicillium oxalicum TaxID=69781 RepID=UPI0020B64383|nr:hypothetical protein POX_a01170 [Penicillium oxalicum]KAI2794571.1 hypothetical protein POX_a01170 [Penicillium oxalicum]